MELTRKLKDGTCSVGTGWVALWACNCPILRGHDALCQLVINDIRELGGGIEGGLAAVRRSIVLAKEVARQSTTDVSSIV